MYAGLFERFAVHEVRFDCSLRKRGYNKFLKFISSLDQLIKEQKDRTTSARMLDYIERYVSMRQTDLKVVMGETPRWFVEYTLVSLRNGKPYSNVRNCRSVIDFDNRHFTKCKTAGDVKKVYRALWNKKADRTAYAIKGMKVTGGIKSYRTCWEAVYPGVKWLGGDVL